MLPCNHAAPASTMTVYIAMLPVLSGLLTMTLICNYVYVPSLTLVQGDTRPLLPLHQYCRSTSFRENFWRTPTPLYALVSIAFRQSEGGRYRVLSVPLSIMVPLLATICNLTILKYLAWPSAKVTFLCYVTIIRTIPGCLRFWTLLLKMPSVPSLTGVLLSVFR